MDVLEGVNLYAIDYYRKTVFKGSFRGLCFRVFRAEVTDASAIEGAADTSDPAKDGDSPVLDGGSPALDGGSEAPTEVLRVQAWKGPYILEKTKEEIFTEDFDFSDEGLEKVRQWLSDTQREVIGND